MEQSNFYSRDTPENFDLMIEVFEQKEGFVWFVECVNTHKWLTGGLLVTDDLTNNPNKARQFKTEISAMTYIIKHKLSGKFIPTEHEFIN